MAIVRTVLGDRNPKELGVILPHEHTLMRLLGAEADHYSSYDREQALETAVKELRAVRESYSISGLVDAAPVDLGRDTEFQAELSRRSGVEIVASTGLFTESVGIPCYWRQRGIDELENFFTKEITEGVVGTGIKCGIIKLATGPEFFSDGTRGHGANQKDWITPSEERAFRAAARVQRKLGVPITTHTHPDDWSGFNVGSKQLDLLEEEGVDVSRCIIGHVSTTGNLRYLTDVVKRGCYIAFDSVGSNWGVGDEVIAEAIAGLVASGYADHILLSHDQCLKEVTRPGGETGLPPDLGIIHREFIPRLLKAGVSEQAIHKMTTENPQAALAF